MRELRTLAFAALLGAVLACCARPPSPACPMRVDDQETPEEAKAGDACHRAGVRLATLKCPEARPDWDAFCQKMLAEGVPICPIKLARVKTCAEVDEVCR